MAISPMHSTSISNGVVAATQQKIPLLQIKYPPLAFCFPAIVALQSSSSAVSLSLPLF